MRLFHLIHIGCCVIVGSLLVGCTLTTVPDSSDRTMVPSPASPTAGPEAPSPTPGRSVWRTDTGPYTNLTHLLSGVCYEYLLQLSGTGWTWNSPDDMTAFFRRADASDLCPSPVQPAIFEFDSMVLVGTVSAAQGCDAAYRFVEVKLDGEDQVQRLVFELVVKPGCAYDLVEPLLIAITRPPEGIQLRLDVVE